MALLRKNDVEALPPRSIYQLLAQANTPASFERHAALRRLAWLNQLKVLSSTDQRDFAEVLWRDRDDTGFPINTPFQKFGFLRLPAPPEIDPNALLKTAFLAGSAFQEVDTEQGVSLDIDGPMTAMHSDLTTLKTVPFEWNPDDVHLIMQRLQRWWPSMKNVWKITPSAWRNHEDATLLLDVLRTVLLPKAGEHADEVKVFIQQVHDHCQEIGMPLAPGSASLQPQEEFNDLVEALMSGDVVRVRQATIRVVPLLQEALTQGDIQRNSHLWELRTVLIAHAIHRFPPALTVTLEAVAHLLAHGLTLEADEQKWLLITLEVLAQETDVRSAGLSSPSREGEHSSLRIAASRLAAALYKMPHLQSHPILVHWAQIGQTDSIPRVRQPWQEHIEK